MKFSDFVIASDLNESLYDFKTDKAKMPKEFETNYDISYPYDVGREYDKLRKKTKSAKERLLFKSYDEYKRWSNYDLQYITPGLAKNRIEVIKKQLTKIEALNKEIHEFAKKYPGYFQNSFLWSDIQEAIAEANGILGDMDLDKSLKRSIQKSKEAVKDYVNNQLKRLREFDKILKNMDNVSLSVSEKIYNFVYHNYEYVRATGSAIDNTLASIRDIIEKDSKK